MAPVEMDRTHDIATFESLYDAAREVYHDEKPPFTQRWDRIRPDQEKEVVIAASDGRHPGLDNSVPRMVLKALKWNQRYFFWALISGPQRIIVKAFSGNPRGGSVYRRYLGFDLEKDEGIYEASNLAYSVPGIAASIRSGCADRSHISESLAPTLVSQDRTSTPRATVSSSMEPGGSENAASVHVPGPTKKRGNKRGAEPPPKRSRASTSTTTGVDRLIREELSYYGKEKPPFAQDKDISTPAHFTAALADQNQKRTQEPLEVRARDCGDLYMCWIATVDGQERVVMRRSGGGGGYRLLLWPGHEEYEHGAKGTVVGFPPRKPDALDAVQPTMQFPTDNPGESKLTSRFRFELTPG
ncbi:MAG: hypothetical protein Q9166_006507 [cf. Caloplaca sp. 2 TL-2023]